jgi:hemolysin activation/secretion protein
VTTIGGAASAGRGEIVGLRAMFDLPTRPEFYQNISVGIDYKNLSEDLVIGNTTSSSPIEYYPLSANYGATWMTKNGFTELNHSVSLGLRGLGSDEDDYGTRRYNASGSFLFLRSDLTHTRDLKGGSQIFGKIQGQLSSQPLLNSEQFSGGGLGTARGYLESTSLGDNGIFGTFELRSPLLLGESSGERVKAQEWRFHAFTDAGLLGIYDPLPSQQSQFGFASVGVGSRFRVHEHYNGSLDLAFPLIEKPYADKGDVRVTFRGWADF